MPTRSGYHPVLPRITRERDVRPHTVPTPRRRNDIGPLPDGVVDFDHLRDRTSGVVHEYRLIA
jgi:hypothetical protein